MNWVSFEIDEHTPIEVLVQRLTSPVVRAAVHPASSGAIVTGLCALHMLSVRVLCACMLLSC